MPDTEPAPPSVDPLPECAWHAEHVNKVRLIGLVGSQPEVRQIGDQAIAQITLGVRGRATSSGMELNWVTVDCWNYEVI